MFQKTLQDVNWQAACLRSRMTANVLSKHAPPLGVLQMPADALSALALHAWRLSSPSDVRVGDTGSEESYNDRGVCVENCTLSFLPCKGINIAGNHDAGWGAFGR